MGGIAPLSDPPMKTFGQFLFGPEVRFERRSHCGVLTEGDGTPLGVGAGEGEGEGVGAANPACPPIQAAAPVALYVEGSRKST